MIRDPSKDGPRDGFHARRRVVADRDDLDRRAARDEEPEELHDALRVGGLAVVDDPDVALELARRLRHLRRRPRVEAHRIGDDHRPTGLAHASAPQRRRRKRSAGAKTSLSTTRPTTTITRITPTTCGMSASW